MASTLPRAAWADSRRRPPVWCETNPVGGWYGLRTGYRGRFGMYLPPLLEALGLAELTHDPRNNRMRAVQPAISPS
jgi:hypothetical protein